MDTVESTLPPPWPPAGGEPPAGDPRAGSADEPRPKWSPRRKWVVGSLAVAVVGLLSGAVFWRLPYYTLSPGAVRDTESFIAVEGTETFVDDAGTISYLTVSVKQATPLEVLAAWIDPAVEVVEAERILGDQTPQENRELNLQLMAGSKDSATYQALSRMGYDIPTDGTGAVVASVADDVPAAAVLTRGDTIVSVDGESVALSDELIDALSTRSPGDVVELGVQALDSDDTRVEAVELVGRPDDPSQPMLGITTFTRDLSFDFPVDVTIDSGRVGGPSAGLAFTLGILDALTPDSVTGGTKVATTGTMELDGQVGPVGGVHQKVVAARRAGVDLMMVPAAEIDEARRYADGLRVEPVEDLDDALAVLATVGGGDAVLPAEAVSTPS
ncbi:YlbL family protein [Rhabdothermincola salaria]|uniref:YlbL family protein n=1 Tax=Rhabdothermincola salaria TaxID=2903142 RepID=UPI001E434F6F|nr:S16 family serine protease [Rhabdothermincola salaria]MCD9625613.1 PDZ domain-containing protein [Rhabdothermincola salaria]